MNGTAKGITLRQSARFLTLAAIHVTCPPLGLIANELNYLN